MRIDLATLPTAHPRLGVDLAWTKQVCAALGLQRHQHVSGVEAALDIEGSSSVGQIVWQPVDEVQLPQHDRHRITEDGAEAVVLVLVHESGGWSVVRRLQREERADWFLERHADTVRYTMALEVSGVDQGPIAGRIAEKVAQVSGCFEGDVKSAAVVGFAQPEATVASAPQGAK